MPSVPKDPKPVRSIPYRMAVATLPCCMCGIEGASQAAHPNAGKAKALKKDDLQMTPAIARAIFDSAQESADREDYYAELIGLVGAFSQEHIGLGPTKALLIAAAYAMEEETKQ